VSLENHRFVERMDKSAYTASVKLKARTAALFKKSTAALEHAINQRRIADVEIGQAGRSVCPSGCPASDVAFLTCSSGVSIETIA
jgi:uncharacterized protein GlcG (DUF336 family)